MMATPSAHSLPNSTCRPCRTWPQDGISITTSAQLDARFGTRERSYFYGGLSFVSKDSIGGPRLDYQVGGVKLGFATKLGDNADIAFGGVARHGRLLNDPFVTEYGGQVSLGFNSGERARWSIDGEIVGQDYKGGVGPSARDGTRYDLGVNYTKASERRLRAGRSARRMS